jgi:ABC-type lipoprotein export system ATPase subunit
MIIKSVGFVNFRNFEGVHNFIFDKINLIQGNVGSGKSTLGRIACIFAIYGEYEDALAKLPTRGKAKTCYVAVKIVDNDDEITIYRELPTKVKIIVNEVEILEGALNTEKDKWLRNRFGDYTYFKKFRMIDKDNGINILDEGATALRKTLVSMNENILANIKKKLTDKKSLFDRYNKDTAVLYKHYPSEKRHAIILHAQKELNLKHRELRQKSDKYNKHRSDVVSEINKNRYRISQCGVELDKLTKSKCVTCGQSIQIAKRNELFIQLETEIEKLQKIILILEEDLKDHDNSNKEAEHELNFFMEYANKVNTLKNKLETRLKQREYIYTNKDVLNVTTSIKELEKFYSQFIMLSVKNLEPIINNITEKIGMSVIFDLDVKGNFDIKIKKQEIDETFGYRDLSSGQRLVLCVAFQMALLIDKGQTGVIIADEGWNNLDSKTAVLLYELFRDSEFQLISVLHRFHEIPEGVKVITLGDYES